LRARLAGGWYLSGGEEELEEEEEEDVENEEDLLDLTGSPLGSFLSLGEIDFGPVGFFCFGTRVRME
jgi:hypothetical protein